MGLFTKHETYKLEFAEVTYETVSSGGLDRMFQSGEPELPVQANRTSAALNELRN